MQAIIFKFESNSNNLVAVSIPPISGISISKKMSLYWDNALSLHFFIAAKPETAESQVKYNYSKMYYNTTILNSLSSTIKTGGYF